MSSTTPAVLPQKPAPVAVQPTPALNKNVPSSLTQLSLPTAQPAPITLPPGSPLSALARPAPSTTPLFTPPAAGPSTAPVGPQGATGAAPPSQVPLQYLNADGSFKTPDQVAHDIGGALASAHGNGDIGTLALDQFGGGDKSAVQLEADARRIGNTRNDIAVGQTDPYKVASESGIAYTPAELKAIESAYAGIYDPALDTALAKVTDKQAADKAKAAADAQANAPFTLGANEVRYDGQGNPIAVGIGSSPGGGAYVAGQNPVVDAYVTGFKNGTYKATDIPTEYKDLVAQGIAAAATAAPLSKTSLDALSIIDEIKNAGDGALGPIAGPQGILPVIPGSPSAKLTNLTKQLQATISLGNRQQLKGSGAISDFEFKVLGDAATALGLDGNGHTNLSKEDFLKSLGDLQLKLEVGPLKTLTDDQVQYLTSPEGGGATPDEIRAIDAQQSFSPVGNTSASTKTSLNRPQRNNNPGNVKQGGLADSLAIGVDDQGHLIFPDATAGFKALTADLTAKINGGSSRLPANPTIAQLGKVYAEDPNWPVKVAAILGVPIDTHTQTVPLANLVKAVATQEGFYA